MSVSFDWGFDESDSGPSRQSGSETEPPGRRRRRPLRWAVLIIALVAAGLASRAWVKSRLDAAKKAEVALKGVVALEIKTIADGDSELFRSLQDPEDPSWRARQIVRYIGRPDFFAPLPSFKPADRITAIDRVHVVGRTGRAELTQWFRATDQLSSDPYPFHVAWFYRQDDDGVWYHVAPPSDYWGILHTWFGTRLVMHATETEAGLLDPIARDLAILVREGCQRLGCAEGVRYNLSFQGDLAPRFQGDRWTLPALYLTGMPKGDESRSVWLRALKRWMVEALVRAQTGRDPMGRVIYRQLLARLWANLSVSEVVPTQRSDSDAEILAEAFRDDRLHSLQRLWESEVALTDPDELRLLEHEVSVLLQWIAAQVGEEQLFRLLPALAEHSRLDTALLATYRLVPLDFEAEWTAYLRFWMGVTAEAPEVSQTQLQALVPPTLFPLSLHPPGDQIAFICSNRIWVGNADGSGLTPLTASAQRFDELYWSPDGRRLLTTWQHSYEASALYWLAADGHDGGLLTNDPSISVFPASWSPDGRQAAFYLWRVQYPGRAVSGSGGGMEVWSADVRTGDTRQLPGIPVWSSEAQQLAYVPLSRTENGPSVWLADADWQNAHQIVAGAQIGPGGGWSPDDSKLALTVLDDDPEASAVVIYDAATEHIEKLISAADLTQSVLALRGDIVTDGSDSTVLIERPLQIMWPVGWSADGTRVAVWAQGMTGAPGAGAPTTLAVIPLEGSAPQVLAYGTGRFQGSPTWSPTNPDQLSFRWQTGSGVAGTRDAFLFDLNGGVVYSALQSSPGAWSPDGSWIAFGEPDRVTVVDTVGEVRASLARDKSCSDVVWNPAADLSALTVPLTLTLTSATDGWYFDNVRIVPDQFSRTVRVWGEVVNRTGRHQRIVTFIPALRDPSRNLIDGERWTFAEGFRELVMALGVADGSALPFGFVVDLPKSRPAIDVAEAFIYVAAGTVEPTREDLDIAYNGFDLSEWPDAIRISGRFENPGPDLTQSVVAVATVYGEDGKVMGWDWRRETDPRYLTSDAFGLDLRVEFSQTITDMDLEIGYYKLQLFGR